jgi:hypothetical protein
MTYDRNEYLAKQKAEAIARNKPIRAFCNYIMYSDVEPFEVVERRTDNKVMIRMMDAERRDDWKPEIIPGGFSGHCVNNHDQGKAWDIKSNEANPLIAVRWSNAKCGWFDSYGGRYSMEDAPRKKYDFNF